jgi:hypothetical protein
MRRLGLVDVLIVALIVILLVLAARHDFGRYADRGQPVAPPPQAPPP